MIQLYLQDQEVDLDPKAKINLNYETTDFTEPQAKITAYSKTVNLVGTPNNDFVFGSIYKLDKEIQYDTNNSMGLNFDPTQKIKFHIKRNGECVESGFAILDSVTTNRNVRIYSLTLYCGAAEFFYNLQYKDDDESDNMTLGDLYYGIDGASQSEENSKTLFNYNAEWIQQAWQYTMLHSDEYDNNSKYMFCPAPTYNGYGVDSSDTVLINQSSSFEITDIFGASSIKSHPFESLLTKTDNDGVVERFYTPYKGWAMCKAQRELDPWEVGSLRSDKMRLAVRNENIFKAVCNPVNNGGYEVDTSNLDKTTLNYINNSYLLLNNINWEDSYDEQNKLNLIFNKDNIWVKWITGYDNPTTQEKAPIVTDTYDLKDFNLPKLTLSILPRIEVERRGSNNTIKAYNPNPKEITTTNAYEDVLSQNKYINTPKVATLFTSYITRRKTWMSGFDITGESWNDTWLKFSSLRPFYPNYNSLSTEEKNAIDSPFADALTIGATFTWIEFLDASNNIISQSTVYLYGCPSDVLKYMDNGRADSLTYLTSKFYDEAKFCFEDFKKNNPQYSGTTFNAHNLFTGEYHPNSFTGRTDEWVGNRFEIEERIPSGSVKFRVQSVFHSTTRPRITLGDQSYNVYTLETEYDYYAPYHLVQRKYKLPPCKQSITSKKYVEMASIGVDREDDAREFYTTEDRYFVEDFRCFTEIKNDKTRIHDGDSVDNENYSLTKRIIFNESCSPYEWLLSIGRMFNLVFTKDLYEDKIYIWNKYQYYDDKVIKIQDKIDKTKSVLDPRTVEHNKYKFSLNPEETYASKLYETKNKLKYGEFIYKPHFNLNTESKDVLEEVSFSNAVPYTMHSVFMCPTEKWYPPQRGATYKWTLFYHDPASNEFETQEKEFMGGLLAKDVSETSDNRQKLCLFDEDNQSVDGKPIFCFLKEWATPLSDLYVTDNIPIVNSLVGSNCHIIPGYLPVYRSVTDEQPHLISFKVANYPLFSNFNDKYNLTCNFNKEDNYINIYDYFHKSEMEQIYTKQNKKITIKVRLEEIPNDALRHYYFFDNSYFIINKIKDYDVENKGFTECEFIKINDTELYGEPSFNIFTFEHIYDISDNRNVMFPNMENPTIINHDYRRV